MYRNFLAWFAGGRQAIRESLNLNLIFSKSCREPSLTSSNRTLLPLPAICHLPVVEHLLVRHLRGSK